jgi:hypothetical protein
MPSRLANSGLLLVFTIICSLLPTPMKDCIAQDQPPLESTQAAFRVETDVRVGTRTEPTQTSLTLFSGGVAYDISFDDPNQITMIDVQRERIVLLNKEARTQAIIDLRQLQQYIESARKQAETSQLAPYLRGADQIDLTNNVVQVGDGVLRYEATLQAPREEQMAQQYARVADALSLLNGWRSGVPPFARLSLNRVVAEQKSLPKEITRTTSGNNQTEVVSCRLHANWRLSKDDEKRVSEIGTMLVSFQTVSPPEFFAALK